MPNEGLRGRRVLVVNDTQEILDLFDAILGDEMGMETVLLSYAPDELDRIVEAAPDLVVVDFVLGGREFEGWQLIQKLRMNRRTEAIPVIACTGATQFVREAEGWLTEQNIATLLKPFTVSQLEHAVHRALDLDARRSPNPDVEAPASSDDGPPPA
jgi:DNA-binding NtrC family response regulator